MGFILDHFLREDWRLNYNYTDKCSKNASTGPFLRKYSTYDWFYAKKVEKIRFTINFEQVFFFLFKIFFAFNIDAKTFCILN